MNDYQKILDVIENTSYLYTDYILKQLKNESCLKFISKIMDSSGKEISEAIIVFLTAIKFIYNDSRAFAKMEQSDNFHDFLKIHVGQILSLSKEKNVQANIPERALPILEVINKKIKNPIIKLIELGASYGLIGRCLLNPDILINGKQKYLSKRQQIPRNYKKINNYLGIELNPPEKKWMIAAIWDEEYECRIRNIINDVKRENRINLIKGNAFGFSELDAVKKITEKPGKIVVLTSFMLYQFESEKRKSLEDEILEFTRKVKGNWINQAVNISSEPNDNEFYISLDNEKIIELPDDYCLKWRWINDGKIS